MFPWLRFLAVCLGLMMFYVGFRQGRWDAFHVYLNGVDIPCKTSPTLRGVDSKVIQEQERVECNCGSPRFLYNKDSLHLTHLDYPTTRVGQQYDPWFTSRLGAMHAQSAVGATFIVSGSSSSKCMSMVEHRAHHCTAIALINPFPRKASSRKAQSYPLIRYDVNVGIDGRVIDGSNDNIVDRTGETEGVSKGLGNYHINRVNQINSPAGHFRRVPKTRGFERVIEKVYPFLQHLPDILITTKKALMEGDVKKGDSVVLIVLNQGESDLFLNFACSCAKHNIALNRVFVFAASRDLVRLVRSTGAMAVYHHEFAFVHKDPSHDYLDRVFVDMMWYKAFSVYVLLTLDIHVLFQDVDFVWFRDPFPSFTTLQSIDIKKIGNGNPQHPIEAFFSDDGQRSKRYAPFFFNSGFYYLLSTPRSKYFGYSIITAFDAIQVTGSHQNVFTMRLIEGLGLGAAYTKILSLQDYPNGILYHHNQSYMNMLFNQQIDPYHFHMCWTQGKPQKLEYLKKAKMWYLNENCTALDNYIPPRGNVFKEMDLEYKICTRNGKEANNGKGQACYRRNWQLLSQKCCAGTGLNKREI